MNKNLEIIVEKLKKIPNCEGIVYSGSRTEGDFIESSDYDFTVLISKGKSYYKIFTYKGLIVDICCATEEIIRQDDLSNRKISNAELAIIANGIILYDKKSRMLDLQKKAKYIWKKGPQKPTKKDIQDASHLLTSFLHKLSKTNSQHAYTFFSEVISKTVNIFFQFHHVWQPKPFEIENSIKKIDKIFFNFYEKANNSNGKIRIKRTKEMIVYLMNKFSLEKSLDYYSIKFED